MSAHCDHCGDETTLDGAFPRDGRGAFRCYCPTCWQRRRARIFVRSTIFFGVALIACGVHAVFYGDRSDRIFAFAMALSLPYLFLSTLLHELGHAAATLLLGLRLFNVCLGTAGRVVFSPRIFGYDFVFRSLPFGGSTMLCCKSVRFARLRNWLVVACGPLTHCAWIALALFVVRSRPQSDLLVAVMWMVIFVDSWQLFCSLWPAKTWTIQSLIPNDGLLLLTLPLTRQSHFQRQIAVRYYLEGLESQERGRFDEALTWFRAGLSRFPGDISNESGLGVVYVDLQRYEEARECFLKLLARTDLEPIQDALFRSNLAWSNLMLGDSRLRSEADSMSKQAFEALPWLADVRGTRGSVLVELGEYELGIELLERALREQTNEKSQALNACYLAMAATRLGLPEEAKRRLEQARQLDPSCPLIAGTTAEIAAADQATAT